MASLWILYTRLRAEEKMLKKAADDRGISCHFVDIRDLAWPGGLEVSEGDVALCRCVSHGHNLAIAKLMESRGVRTVNHSSVMEACGDKVVTASILDASSIPQPDYRVAFSPEGAVKAAESLGYPVVFKPPVGSWGRLISKVNDRDCAESLVEHKSFMGPNHGTFFIQKYVEKPGYDVRALIVGGKPISAIKRASSHWITNTARGAEAQLIPLDDSLSDILSSVYRAFGGDLLAVDLFQNGNSWSVNEVNGQAEFHGSVEGSGVDVAGAIISHCQGLIEGDK